jgi:hypothetical protein
VRPLHPQLLTRPPGTGKMRARNPGRLGLRRPGTDAAKGNPSDLVTKVCTINSKTRKLADLVDSESMVAPPPSPAPSEGDDFIMDPEESHSQRPDRSGYLTLVSVKLYGHNAMGRYLITTQPFVDKICQEACRAHESAIGKTIHRRACYRVSVLIGGSDYVLNDLMFVRLASLWSAECAKFKVEIFDPLRIPSAVGPNFHMAYTKTKL